MVLGTALGTIKSVKDIGYKLWIKIYWKYTKKIRSKRVVTNAKIEKGNFVSLRIANDRLFIVYYVGLNIHLVKMKIYTIYDVHLA